MGMGVRSPYNGPMAPLATGMTTELTPEQAALEQYLMEQAVDEGMKLHHARLEAAHSRFAASLRFADFLEEVENEDVRRGAAPLLAGTGQKMPSWIRASEVMAPEMELLNEAMRDLEEKASAAELQRAHDAILDEVDMAARLLAETDPQAGISLDDSADSPEALDALFWDEDALLPGLKSTPEEEKVDDMLTEYLKELLPGTTDNLEVADIYGGMGTGGVDIVASSLQGLSGHVSSVLEEVGALNKDEGGSEEEELEAAEVDVEGSFEGDHAEDPEAWAAAKAATGHITDDE